MSSAAAVCAKHAAERANDEITAQLDAMEASRPADLSVLRPPHREVEIPEMMLSEFVFQSMQAEKTALIAPPVEVSPCQLTRMPFSPQKMIRSMALSPEELICSQIEIPLPAPSRTRKGKLSSLRGA